MVMSAAYVIAGIPDVAMKVKKTAKERNIAKAEKMIKNICAYFGFSVEQIRVKKGGYELQYCKQWCHYFCANETQLSLKEIGELMGGRDHSTVIHNRTIVFAQLTSRLDNEYKSDYDIVRRVAFNGMENHNGGLSKKKKFQKKVDEMARPNKFERPKAVYSNTQWNEN